MTRPSWLALGLTLLIIGYGSTTQPTPTQQITSLDNLTRVLKNHEHKWLDLVHQAGSACETATAANAACLSALQAAQNESKSFKADLDSKPPAACGRLAVSSLDEGIDLTNSGIQQTIDGETGQPFDIDKVNAGTTLLAALGVLEGRDGRNLRRADG
jgi:hypothetical protein